MTRLRLTASGRGDRRLARLLLLVGFFALLDLGCSSTTMLQRAAGPVALEPASPPAATTDFVSPESNPLPTPVRPPVVSRLSGVGDVTSAQNATAESQAVPALFQDIIEGVARAEAPGPEIVRSRLVRIDVGLLRGTSTGLPSRETPQALQLNLFDDANLTAEVDRLDSSGDDLTWVGHVVGDPLSSVTLSSVGSVVSGSVATADAVYAIRYVAEAVHEIQEIDQSAYPPELEPRPGPPTPDIDRRPETAVFQERLPVASADPVTSTDDGGTIDVMVLYTPAARQAAGGTSGIQSRINLGISESNTSYANSGVAQRLRLVHSQEVSHTENNDLAEDLYLLTNYNGNWISTDIGNTAAALRETHTADLVMLVTNPASPGGCGIAWLMTSVSTGFAPYGFSVVWENCISPNYTFAHELGHNMGARHDWFVDNAVMPHTYAHGYVSAPDRWRTVMAYNNLCSVQGFSCTRLLHWSNPGVTYGGVPMGIAGGTRFNCALGDINDTACDADDHRTLNDTAWTVANFRQLEVLQAPIVTTHPAPARTAVGGTVGFTAAATGNPTPTVRWQTSADGGTIWTDLTESFRYVGVTSTTLTITNVPASLNGTRVRAVFTNSQGSAPTNAALFEVTTTVSFSPGVLNYGATKAGAVGPLIVVTPAQAVTVTFSGTTSAWTAQSDVAWLQVTGGTGNGGGQFAVSVVNPGNVIGGSTTLSGNILVDVALAPTLLRVRLPVALTVDQTGGAVTLPPFGIVDTPQQNATGIVGTIGVTGWVLDDVGVSGVQVYRNCLAFEPPGNCVSVLGQNLVFVGDATPVAGARPDVEATYPQYPQANRAGWGYLLLTNLLPHVPMQQMFGGQGPVTLFAVARDAEGQAVFLGRTQVDTTPTSILMDNDHIAKPFGAIDTPAQGETTGGVFPNFGWALTPDGNTVAEGTDILVPVNGSTVRVWIDGVPGALVTYNQCRGDAVLGPVGPGQWCDDDVANIFGNLTPLPTFTPRTANVTKHRNLDVGRGAIGALLIDTRLLANGVHTIMWGVTDTAGRGDGIGSRYFTVLNTGTDARAGTGDRPTSPDALPRGFVEPGGPGASSVSLSRRDTPDPRSPVPGPGHQAGVFARTGFSLDVPFAELVPDADGVRHVRLGDLDRLELRFAGSSFDSLRSRRTGEDPASRNPASSGLPVTGGYLVANGRYRSLPVGSHLDTETGTFTWAPGVGFLGTYRLAFGAPEEASFPRTREPSPSLVIDVTIRPVAPPAPGEAAIRMALDLPQPGATVRGAFVVAGWALDPHAAIGAGIGAVHVWAQRTDVAGAAPVFLGAAALQGQRPDVAGIYGAQFAGAGYNLAVGTAGSAESKDPASRNTASRTLPPGTYAITAYVWATRTARWEDARAATITIR